MKNKTENSFTRVCIFLINKLWLLLATLIIILALIVTLFRILVPQVTYFKTDIIHWVEENYHLDIDVSQVNADWGIKGPIIAIDDFELKLDEQGSSFKVDSVIITIDTLWSVISRRLTTESIEISGASLHFYINRNLGVNLNSEKNKINEKDYSEVQQTSRLFLTHLFGQKRLVVKHSDITLETLAGRQFNYRIEQLEIKNYDEIHQITGQLIDIHQGQLNLVAEINGDPASENSTASLYLEGQNVDVSKLPGYENYPDLRPLSGNLNWRLWGDWVNGRWQSALGDIELTELIWQKDNHKSGEKIVTEANVERFSLEFNWLFEETDSGVLSFKKIKLKQMNAGSLLFPSFNLFFKQSGVTDIQWDIVTRNFELMPVVEYASAFLESRQSLNNVFADLSLGLNIDQFGLRLKRENGAWNEPVVISEFSNLSSNSTGQLPDVNNLKGSVTLKDAQGWGQVNGLRSKIGFKQLFREPLSYEMLTASFNWQSVAGQPLEILIDEFLFTNKDLTIAAKSRIYTLDDKPSFSLYAEISEVDASQKSRYLPTGIMSPGLVDYLDSSILAGRVGLGKVVVHGPLSSFPFDNTDGVFLILGDVENVEYQYLPDWPVAKQLSATLLFNAKSMEITSKKAISERNYLNYARAKIKDFSAPDTPLQLTLGVSSKNNSGRNFILKTPLKSIGEALKELDYKGQYRTRLDMSFGLEDSSDLKLDGRVSLKSRRSRLAAYGFAVDKVKGKVLFNHQGVTSGDFKANYYGLPLVAKLSGSKTSEKVNALYINISGNVKAESLKDILQPHWLKYASGQTDFKAGITVFSSAGSSSSSGRETVRVDVSSSLQGIQLELPAPFSKLKKKKSPLAVRFALNKNDLASIALSWDKFKANWWWKVLSDRNEQLGGQFLYDSDTRLTKGKLRRYQADLNFEKLAMNPWIEFFNKHVEQFKYSTSQQNPQFDLSLNIKELLNPYLKLKNIAMQADSRQANEWDVGVKTDSGNADLKIRNKKPLTLLMSDLNLFLVESASEADSKMEETRISNEVKVTDSISQLTDKNDYFFKLENWQDINVRCNHCIVENRVLGDVEANLTLANDEILIKGSAVNNNEHNLAFSVLWRQPDPEKSSANSNLDRANIKLPENYTQLEFKLDSGNVGELMKHWDYPVGVEDSDGTLSGRVWWNDLPWNFELKKVEGDSSFSFGEGHLNDVSDAKVRVFSLLSLQSLFRKLRLDFRDVYKEGFFYNDISGSLSLREGVVTSDDVYIDGKAAKVKLSGSLNLNTNILEQHAVITPELTSSLPMLIGWAIEPTTGILFFLLNKMLEPAIEVVTSIEYRIYGPLDQIKVEEVKKSKSKVNVEMIDDYEPAENSTKMKDEFNEIEESFIESSRQKQR